MTFNTAFKHLYEKKLKPYGFQKVKGKRPYFIRMIGDEIFHMITYRNCWSERPYKEFQIIWGVGTVYREKIDLDVLPYKTLMWAKSAGLYMYRDLSLIIPGKPYEIGKNDVDMETELDYSMEEVKKEVLPRLERAVTLERCYEYLDTYLFDEENFDGDFRGHNEGLINYILFDPKIYEEVRGKHMEDLQRERNRRLVMEMLELRSMDNQPAIFKKYLEGEENYRLIVETLKRRKRENHERLSSHGIVF